MVYVLLSIRIVGNYFGRVKMWLNKHLTHHLSFAPLMGGNNSCKLSIQE